MQSTFNPTPQHCSTEDFASVVRKLEIGAWRPAFPTLHNTGVPSLAQWMAFGSTPQERWGANLNRYYAGLGWHAGPHVVVCPDYIWLLSDFAQPGVSVSCWNSITFGIEMVGNYEVGGDEFDSGVGAKVRDNAAKVLALLADRFGWSDLSDYACGERGLHFHHECTRDHHACPGSKVIKADMLQRISALRSATGVDHKQSEDTGKTESSGAPAAATAALASMQSALNRLGAAPSLSVDGVLGPATHAALLKFQQGHGLVDDWTPGPRTADLLAKLSADVA